jgi:exopolysaccharide production protein ExoQ
MILVSLWTPSPDMPGWLVPGRYAIYLGCAAIIMIAAYASRGVRVPFSSEAALMAAFMFYVVLSAVWSTRDVDTYIKSILVLTTLLAALSVSSLFDLDHTLNLVFSAVATFVVICVLVALFIPSIGVEDSWEHAGKWRGISGQKNGLGAASAQAFVMGIVLPLRNRSNASSSLAAFGVRAVLVMVCALATYMSGSRGAQMMAMIGLVSVVIALAPGLLQRLMLLSIPLLAIPIFNLAVSTFFIDADKIGIVGLTINTNSRTTIWEYGLRQMEGRELLGYGVNGFWTHERMQAFKDVHGWVLDNFHNGYITIIVEGGLVGFMLLILAIGFTYLLLLVAIGSLKDRVLAAAFAFTNIFIISNLVENVAGRSTSLSIIVIAIIAFSLRTYIAKVLASTQTEFINHATKRQPRLNPL